MTATELTVVGMTCGHCVASVTEELEAVPGVRGVEVDLSSGRVVVTSDAPIEDAALHAAVVEAGYQVAP